jgi:hypothetical protein
MTGTLFANEETSLLRFSDSGLVEGVVSGDREVAATSKKGFYSLPGVGKGTPDFLVGSFAQGKLELANGSGLRLEATVKNSKGCTEIAGYIEKITKGDRAVWLVFEIPSLSDGWRVEDSMDNRAEFSTETYKKKALPGIGATGNNIFPMIAGIARTAAIGMALAPDTPCIFITDGGKDRLGIRMALGLSDATKTPNRAPFKIQVYDLDPEWGFRGLLEKYYNNHPESYETTPPSCCSEPIRAIPRCRNRPTKKERDGCTSRPAVIR